jgi:hypothetical protein
VTEEEKRLWCDTAARVAAALAMKYELSGEIGRGNVSVHAGQIADGVVSSFRARRKAT